MGKVVDFTAADSDYYSGSFAPVEDHPVSFTAWCNFKDAGTYAILAIEVDNAPKSRFFMLISSTTLYARIIGSGTTEDATISGAVSVGTWQHFAAIYGSSTHRVAAADGVKGTPNTNTATIGSPDSLNTYIGRRPASGWQPNVYMADARIYGVALSDPALAAQHDGKTRWELYYPIGRTKYVVITGAPPPSDTFFEE
jgi:hypothetical protein